MCCCALCFRCVLLLYLVLHPCSLPLALALCLSVYLSVCVCFLLTVSFTVTKRKECSSVEDTAVEEDTLPSPPLPSPPLSSPPLSSPPLHPPAVLVGQSDRDRHWIMSSCDEPAVDAAAIQRKYVPNGLKLTAKEEQIFTTLRAVIAHNSLTTTIRVAGGWVRDKILGKLSDDIDLALDNMLGAEFAAMVNSYLVLQGDRCRSIGVIKVNPEASKHLETATFKIHGQAIDVNNLRSECYDADSRIPKMEIGTPYDDAIRRDFTVNSFFYNINTGQIEDYTGLAWQDLDQKLIRTPREPLVTFDDDPLRVLRAIRFAGRFSFALHPSIAIAASNPAIKEALLNKVSRERYGQELSKIFACKTATAQSVFVSLEWLSQFDLLDAIFLPPADYFLAAEGEPKEQLSAEQVQQKKTDERAKQKEGLAWLGRICTLLDSPPSPSSSFSDSSSRVAPSAPSSSLSHADVSQQQQRRPLPRMPLFATAAPVKPDSMGYPSERPALLLAAFLLPWKGFVCLIKKKPVTVAHYIIGDSIKLSNTIAKLASLLIEVAGTAKVLLEQPPALLLLDSFDFNFPVVAASAASSSSSSSMTEETSAIYKWKVQAGAMLREVGIAWSLLLDLSQAYDLSYSLPPSSSFSVSPSAAAHDSVGSALIPSFASSSSAQTYHVIDVFKAWLVLHSGFIIFSTKMTQCAAEEKEEPGAEINEEKKEENILQIDQQDAAAISHESKGEVIYSDEDCVWNWRPFFNGAHLKSEWGLTPKEWGPKLGEIQQKQMEWRLGHPFEGKEACRAFMDAMITELKQNHVPIVQKKEIE